MTSLQRSRSVRNARVEATRLVNADAETLAIDKERREAVTHADIMVGPEGVLEERLIDIYLFHAVGVDGVHQAAVVHHDTRRLLRERLTRGVDDVDETGVREVLDVVHHRSTGGLNLVSQLADIGRRRTLNGDEIEQFLELGQVFQFYLLDEQDIHLQHHVHGLQQVLGEVAMLEEERIKAVVQVALEEIQRIDLGEDVLHNPFMMLNDVLKAIGREVVSGLEVQELTEREASQVIALDKAIELGVLLLEAHHRGTGEDDAQARVLIMATAQFLGPIGLLEHLVDEQHLTPTLSELAGEVRQAATLEVEVVHVDVQALVAAYIKILLSILKEERRLADTARALDTDEGLTPVNLIHQQTAHRQVGVLYKIGVGSEECFHV